MSMVSTCIIYGPFFWQTHVEAGISNTTVEERGVVSESLHYDSCGTDWLHRW